MLLLKHVHDVLKYS